MLNLVVSCDIPGRAQDCMILLRAKTEIAPTINSDAGSSLIDRPILFICAESVLNEGQSFFCRETFTIPPQLRSCSEVSVKFTWRAFELQQRGERGTRNIGQTTSPTTRGKRGSTRCVRRSWSRILRSILESGHTDVRGCGSVVMLRLKLKRLKLRF